MEMHTLNSRENEHALSRHPENKGLPRARQEAGFLHLEAAKGRSKGRSQFTSLRRFFKGILGKNASCEPVLGLFGSYYSILGCALAATSLGISTLDRGNLSFPPAVEFAIMGFLPHITY